MSDMNTITRPTFGPGGNGELFAAQGGKSTVDMPEWLYRMGLDAYEYEAGRGTYAQDDVLRQIGDNAEKYGILVSLHTPYFISLSGVDPEKRLKSVDYIMRALRAARCLRADTVVIHSGSAGKISRSEAMRLSCDTLERVIDAVEAEEKGTGEPLNVRLGIETMGKVNQLGTLDEVIEQCRVHPRFYPVVDFGHLNARCGGGLFPDADSYRHVFDRVASGLGDEKAKTMHCHFSKIEYTAAGEQKHLTFADQTYGPAYEPLMEAIARDNLCPRIICESAGTMPEDALTMKTYWQQLQQLQKQQSQKA